MAKAPTQMAAPAVQAVQSAPTPDKRAQEKRAAFVKLANARLGKALKAISILRNLANKNNYSFVDKDRELLIAAIDKQRNAVDEAFKSALAGRVQAEEGETFFS